MSKSEFTRRLGEAGCGRESGRVGLLNVLARAGLPVPEGTVLTQPAHEEFLRTSGILRDIRVAGRRAAWRVAEILSKHASHPVEGELNQAICQLLIGLNARTAVVIYADIEKGGLRSIPEVRDAVRDAWLSPRGLERQIAAIARGEDIPTWPVLIQKEVHPQYTGWSTLEGASICGGEGVSIGGFTPTPESVLGAVVKIRWGLEDGRWYVLSASPSR